MKQMKERRALVGSPVIGGVRWGMSWNASQDVGVEPCSVVECLQMEGPLQVRSQG